MQKLIITFFLFSISFHLPAQYYIRGEVKDERNQALQNVKIFQHSSRFLFYSGSSGGFGITSSNLFDSLTFTVEGFESKTVRVKCDQYQVINLKSLANNATLQKPRPVSITKNLPINGQKNSFFGDESYSTLVENEFIKADKYPGTGFAVRIDKASYSNIRRFLNQKGEVPVDAVRIEEMLNYFNFNYRQPPQNVPFDIESQLSSCPWDGKHQLLFLNINAQKLPLEKIPPSNFVFLIDVSGSMDMPNRLPLLKAAFQLLVKNLRTRDTVSIVIYGGAVGVWLPPTGGDEKQKITRSIEELYPSGSTPGEAAIRSAYKLAERSFIKGGNNRIILATDGDFNVGQVSEKELEDLISSERQSGVYLTCLGVGMGNYKDSKIEALAKKGNGNFAYLDDIREAEKVLVTELTQNLYTVATDVFINMNFDPTLIKEYRLIGYDNKKDIPPDSPVELEGGEVGSGTGITAIFEIIPADHNPNSPNPPPDKSVATLTLNYRLGEDTTRQKMAYPCRNNYKSFKEITMELKFASAVTEFGLMLRQSRYLAGASWSQVETIATEAAVPGDFLQNEFIELVDKARKIYTKKKKKKDDGF